MSLAGKSVLVLGLGISGRSAAAFCAARGADVLAADESDVAPDSLAGLDARVRIQTGCALPDPADFDIVVPSPGIPHARYAARAKRIWGDIELVWQALEMPIVAVTGTNGKSTTVLLVEAMLRAAGLRARAAGNLGIPALSLVGEPLDVAVLEVSSFQLEAIDGFAPRVSAILNVSPDHIDRHGSFEAYVAAKKNIFRNQRGDDTVVLNFDDPLGEAIAAEAPARVLPFSRRKPLQRGVFLDSTAIVLHLESGTRRLPLDDLDLDHYLAGAHNLENVLAAVAIVSALDVDPAVALRGLRGFEGLPHRCEVVATVDGVTYIDDSKATNPGAAQRSLEGQPGKPIWIAGGRDKGLDFRALADSAAVHAKHVLLIGEATALIEEALAGRVTSERLDSLESAVVRAAQCAEPGDVVLLAPACASFDQFESYQERGLRFCEAVRALNDAGDSDDARPSRDDGRART